VLARPAARWLGSRGELPAVNRQVTRSILNVGAFEYCFFPAGMDCGEVRTVLVRHMGSVGRRLCGDVGPLGSQLGFHLGYGFLCPAVVGHPVGLGQVRRPSRRGRHRLEFGELPSQVEVGGTGQGVQHGGHPIREVLRLPDPGPTPGGRTRPARRHPYAARRAPESRRARARRPGQG